eukprot:4940266-Pleurochrysis_carterae.AAC.1
MGGPARKRPRQRCPFLNARSTVIFRVQVLSLRAASTLIKILDFGSTHRRHVNGHNHYRDRGASDCAGSIIRLLLALPFEPHTQICLGRLNVTRIAVARVGLAAPPLQRVAPANGPQAELGLRMRVRACVR